MKLAFIDREESLVQYLNSKGYLSLDTGLRPLLSLLEEPPHVIDAWYAYVTQTQSAQFLTKLIRVIMLVGETHDIHKFCAHTREHSSDSWYPGIELLATICSVLDSGATQRIYNNGFVIMVCLPPTTILEYEAVLLNKGQEADKSLYISSFWVKYKKTLKEYPGGSLLVKYYELTARHERHFERLDCVAIVLYTAISMIWWMW